jgi:hypothetical protein
MSRRSRRKQTPRPVREPVRLKQAHRHGDRDYQPGDTINLRPDQIARLRRLNII